VSEVELVVVNGITITTVTFTDAGTAQTFRFCGDVVRQFLTRSFVIATYKHGGGCETVESVSRDSSRRLLKRSSTAIRLAAAREMGLF
jgi:hypothetical protein